MPGTSPGMTKEVRHSAGWARRSVPTIRAVHSNWWARRKCAFAQPTIRALRLHRRLRPVLIPQMPLHQFPGRRARQLRLEVDALRAFDRRQMLAAEHDQFGLERL